MIQAIPAGKMLGEAARRESCSLPFSAHLGPKVRTDSSTGLTWMKLAGVSSPPRGRLFLVGADARSPRRPAKPKQWCSCRTADFSSQPKVAATGPQWACLRFFLLIERIGAPGRNGTPYENPTPQALIPPPAPWQRACFPLRCPLIGVVHLPAVARGRSGWCGEYHRGVPGGGPRRCPGLRRGRRRWPDCTRTSEMVPRSGAKRCRRKRGRHGPGMRTA